MKKISFNDYIPEELVDSESCRLVTTEQYKEYQLLKKKLDIAVKILQMFAFDYDDETKQKVFIENSLIALKEIEEVKE